MYIKYRLIELVGVQHVQCTVQICELYTGLFLPRIIFVFQHMLTVSLCLEFAQTLLCLRRDNLRIGIHPVLNSSVDNEGKMGQNIPGANISLYTICDYFSVTAPQRLQSECSCKVNGGYIREMGTSRGTIPRKTPSYYPENDQARTRIQGVQATARS